MTNIRSIQHYFYCPRRFSLIEINGDWEENAHVTRGNIVHENVHEGKHAYSSAKKLVLSNVSVYNDELDLYGVLDCIEFEKCAAGDFIEKLGDRRRVRIVEYKPTAPKDGQIRESDAIQVFAQKLCADSVWKCDSEGYMYYADTMRRMKLDLRENYEKYYEIIKNALNEMNRIKEAGVIADKTKGQNCGGCSLKPRCLPGIKKYSVKEETMRGDGVCESF